jgi:rubrerythrin
MFSLHDIVSVAIKIEENGERTYREAASKVGDPQVAELLTKLADQEVDHAQWFAKLGESALPTDIDQELAGMGESLLHDIVGGERFSLADVDLSTSEGVAEVFKAAIELERDTVIFYEMIGSFLSDPVTSEQIESIIAEETSHEQRLQAYLEGKAEGSEGS